MDGLHKYALSTDKSYAPGEDEQEKITKIQYEFCVKMQSAEESEFIETARKLRAELDSPILYFKSIFKSGVPKFIQSTALLKCVIECFDCSQINKKKLMQSYIDADKVDLLEVCIKHGWLEQPKKRDELIDYANQNGKTEAEAFLLDFKNRTADLATEREKAEKKQERELNAAPDSVTALKQIWSYKKRNDGTLMITGYKGTRTEVVVPEHIGKNIVTAIGKNAFCPFAARVTNEAKETRKAITRITLPETVRSIEDGAFWDCENLISVNIPESVKMINKNTFAECRKLENIVIPTGVKRIEERAFYCCNSLKFLIIPEGAEFIGDNAFALCDKLITVVLPSTLKMIGYNVISRHIKPIGIVAPNGSYAAGYCEKNGLPYANAARKVTPRSKAEEYCRDKNIPYIYKE